MCGLCIKPTRCPSSSHNLFSFIKVHIRLWKIVFISTMSLYFKHSSNIKKMYNPILHAPIVLLSSCYTVPCCLHRQYKYCEHRLQNKQATLTYCLFVWCKTMLDCKVFFSYITHRVERNHWLKAAQRKEWKESLLSMSGRLNSFWRASWGEQWCYVLEEWI